MGDSLVYKLRSGKPPKFIYFAYDNNRPTIKTSGQGLY